MSIMLTLYDCLVILMECNLFIYSLYIQFFYVQNHSTPHLGYLDWRSFGYDFLAYVFKIFHDFQKIIFLSIFRALFSQDFKD